MNKKLVKSAFVAAIVMVSGITVYNSQKSEIKLSDVVMANVEALASDSEGIPWRGYVLDSKNSCCKFVGMWSVECSGDFGQCKE